MQVDEENLEYLNKIHPYAEKNQPKTILQAIFANRSRLKVGYLYKSAMQKCKFQNETLYDKELKELPLEERSFKHFDEIDVHCYFKVNNMLRGRFLKQEWEIFDCFEECEKRFPRNYYKYVDFNIFWRTPCNRRCEDEFNDKTWDKVEKIQQEIANRKFTYQKGEIVIPPPPSGEK